MLHLCGVGEKHLCDQAPKALESATLSEFGLHGIADDILVLSASSSRLNLHVLPGRLAGVTQSQLLCKG